MTRNRAIYAASAGIVVLGFLIALMQPRGVYTHARSTDELAAAQAEQDKFCRANPYNLFCPLEASREEIRTSPVSMKRIAVIIEGLVIAALPVAFGTTSRATRRKVP
jgi:hypothetical protein